MPRTPMPKKPFIPASGVIQLEAVYSQFGQFMENVFHILQGDGATAATVSDMTAACATYASWEAEWGAGPRSSTASLVSLTARDLSTQEGPSVYYTTGLPIAGAIVGTPMPSNVTVAVKWNTALGGRSFRGRTYWIGMDGVSRNGDQIVPAFQTSLLNIYNHLLTMIPAGHAGQQLVVLSYAHNKAWRTAAVATPIVAPSVNLDLDSQRRRLAGRGS